MRFLAILATALCLALGAFFSSGDPPTVEQSARDDYARITAEANIFTHSDKLSWRTGETTPIRVPADCMGSACAIGFINSFRPSDGTSLEGVNLGSCGDRCQFNGI